eukprot:TRINITY_DN4185_c1_g1_i2.p1 TRINITY_DN4185_c1_g1~~TRINITY_DN4185_c1_g1_i2.p1  ORF type:complete len:3215 (+),score=887.21 TRINITY_DN4185_c1_g1_i2:87-9647(+)
MDPEPPHAAGAEAGAWAQQLREAGLRSAPDAPEAAEEAAAFATALRAACADYSAGAAQRPPPPSPSAGPETPAEFWLRVGWCERVQQTLRDATQGRLLPSQGEVEDVRAAVAALGEALAAAATEAAERGAPPAEPAAGLIVAGDLGLWEWRSPAAAGRMVSHARLVNTYAVALGLPTLRALTHTLLRWGGRTLTVTCLAPLASGAQAAATGSCSARLQLTLLAEALGGRQAAAALGVDGRLYVADPRLLCEAPHLAMLRSSAGAAGGAAAAADEASMQAVLRQAGGSPTGQELCAALRSHGMGARHLGALRRAAIASGSGTVAEACLAEAVARSAKAVALGSRLLAAAAQSDEPGAAARVVAALCGSLPEVWQSAVLPQLRDRYSAGGGEGAWADLSDGLSPERQERAAARLCDLCGLPPAPPPRWVRSGVWRPVPVRTSLPDTNFLYSAEAASSAEAAAASDPSSPAAQLLTASLRAARGDEGASEALLRYGSTAPAPWGGAHAEECAAALAFGGAEPSDAARVQRESIAHRLEAMDPEEGSVAAPDWADIARQIGVAAGMQPAAGPPRSPASSGSGGTEAVLPPGAAERCHSGLSAATEISRVAAAYSCWLPLLYALRSVPGGSTEEVAQELLELLTELVGDRDPEVAALCSEIGTARMQRGGLRAMEAAEPYLLRALAVFRRAAGPEAPDTATALVNLGYLSYRTARLHSKRSSRVPSFGMRPHLSPEGREHYEKAEDAFLSVLQMPEGALPPDVEGHALNNLGSCYVGMGRWSDAEGCFERAVALGGVGSAQDAELAAQNLAAMRDARRTQGAVTIQAFVRGSAGRRRARDRRAARAAAAEGTVKEVPAAPAEEPPAAPGSAPEPQPPDSGAAPAPAQDQGEELEEGQPQRPPPSALPPPSGAQEQPAEPQPSAAPPPQEAGPQRQPQGFVKAMAAQWDDKEKKAQREESEGERRERLEAARKERQQEKAAQPRPAAASAPAPAAASAPASAPAAAPAPAPAPALAAAAPPRPGDQPRRRPSGPLGLLRPSSYPLLRLCVAAGAAEPGAGAPQWRPLTRAAYAGVEAAASSKDRAAVEIQRVWRGRKGRSRARARAEQRWRHAAAAAIQRCFRSQQARKEAGRRRSLQRRRRMYPAACCKIQSAWRGHAARGEMGPVQRRQRAVRAREAEAERLAALRERRIAALMIQRTERGWRGRRAARARRAAIVVLQRIVNGYLGRCAVHAVYTAWLAWRAEQKAARSRGEHAELEARVGLDEAERSERREVHTEQRKEEYGIRRRYLAGILRKCADPFGGMSDELTPAEALMVGETQEEEERDLYEHKESDERRRLAAKWQHWRMDVLALQASGPALVGQEARERKRNAMTAWRTRREIAKQMLFERSRFALHHLRRMVSVEEWRLPKLRYLQCLAWAARATPLHASRGRGLAVMFDAAMRAPEYGGRLGRGRGLAAVADAFGYATSLTDIRREEDGKRGADAEAEHAEAAQRREAARAEEHTCRRELAAQEHSERIALEAAGRASARRAHAAAAAAADQDAPLTPRPTPAGVPLEEQNARWAIGKAETAERAALDSRRFRHAALVALRMPPRVGSAQYQRTPQQQLPPRASSARPPARSSLRSRTAPSGPSRREPVHFDHSAQYSGDRHHAPSAGSGSVPPHEGVAGEGDDGEWLFGAAEAASPATDATPFAHTPHQTRMSSDGGSPTGWSPLGRSSRAGARGRSASAQSVSSAGSASGPSPLRKRQLRSYSPDGREVTSRRLVERNLRRQVFSARARQGLPPGGEWDADGKYIGRTAERIGAPRQRSAPARRATDPVDHFSLKHWQSLMEAQEEMEGPGWESDELRVVHGQVVAHAVRQHKEGYEEEIGDYGQLSGAVAGQAVVLRRDLDGLWRDVGGQAATRLQANWRGFLVRSRDRPLQRARERWAEWERRAEQDDAYAAARLIQKRVRGILGRRYVREWEQTREAAVVVLQWRWREHIIRRDQREAAIERNAAASVIQEWYGGFAKIREARALRERKRAQFLKEELQRAERDRIRREDGAARVQRWWRALQTTRRLIENERLMLLLKRESRRGLFTLDEDPEVRSRRHVEEDAARAAADRRAHAPAKVLHTVSAAGRRARERFAGAERCTAVEQWRMEQQRRGHNRRSAATAMQRWWRAAHARYRYRIDLARYKKAAVTAQRVYRGHACRNRVLKDKRVRKAAAIRVQAWFRCLVKRSKFLSWRHAGCVFQAVWRGRMQRREWEIIRKQRALERRWQIRRTAATKLQSAVRARNARRLVGGMLADRLGARECSKRAGAGAVLSRVLRGAACRRKQRRRAAAARAIQVWFRYLVANRAFHARWKVVDRAAQTIGRVVRVKVAHIKAQRRRAEVRREREAELRSEHRRWGAITIQCGARMLLARNAARRRREHLEEVRRREAAERELKRRHVAAQRIQTRWRGYAARLEFGSIHAECRRAACMIQARWRGWATRRCWGAFLPASRAAALVLHRFGRRCVMIHRVRLRKALRAEAAGRALRRAAAVHIQAQTRGMLARMRRDRILRRRYRAALDIERVWRGFVGRCSTREAMHMRRFGVRTIQRTWRGHSARMRARKLAAARAARRRQQQLWERELFLALDARLNRLVEVEDVQRPCLEEVEHGAWLDIIEAFDAEGRRVRKRQELIWRRRRWRQSCEGRELATMSAIDAELTALWQTAYDAWDATRAAARRESEAAEDVSRRRISGAEVREWAVVHRTCSHGLREVRVGEAQRAWTRRREEERLAEERRRQEEESALSSGQRRLRQWRESRIEGRRKQEAEQRDERRRRKFLSAREKCSEFAQHYLSRRMAECRKTIAAEPDSSDASPSPPRRQRDPVLAACVRNASSPQRQMACALSPAARRFASPPRRSSMTDAAVRTSESIPLSDLQRSHRPATAGAKDAKLPAAPGLPRAPADSVMAASMSGSCSASFVAPPLAAAQPSASSRGIDGHWGEGAPLRAARAFGDAAEAAEWLARQGGPGSPLARRRPSSAGPLGAARRQHVLPGTSARGRVQHYLPLLAANDRGLVEVDLAGAGLSDVLVHSLAVALRGNRRCAALQLDRNRMTDAALEVLAPALHTHPTLASITLRDNLLTDDGVQMLVHAVQANPVLRRIDVTGNAAVTSAALEELEGALVANQKLRTAKRTANAAATAAAQQPLFVEG